MGSSLPGQWDVTCGNKPSKNPDVAQSCQTAVWAGKGYKGCSRKGDLVLPSHESHPPTQQMHPEGDDLHRGGVRGKGADQGQLGKPWQCAQLQGDLISLLPVTQGPSVPDARSSLHVTSPWVSQRLW